MMRLRYFSLEPALLDDEVRNLHTIKSAIEILSDFKANCLNNKDFLAYSTKLIKNYKLNIRLVFALTLSFSFLIHE